MTQPADLGHDELVRLLTCTDPERLARLYAQADAVRRETVGSDVHLRALVEVSNVCARRCAYCGIAAYNGGLARYRMDEGAVVRAAQHAARLGLGTTVLQAGEDPALDAETVALMVRAIKESTGMAVTLSLGERSNEELALWRKAGADRYLLRFETSDDELFAQIHPPAEVGALAHAAASATAAMASATEPASRGSQPRVQEEGAMLARTSNPRFAVLESLRELGYEVGSGVMVGIPGQSFETLASDLQRFSELELDMVGIGPFIPHPDTPLGAQAMANRANGHALARLDEPSQPSQGFEPAKPTDQVPADANTTFKMLALTRLLLPGANIPATTALGVMGEEAARRQALDCGANVVMPNFTPPRFRALYSIYEGKDAESESGKVLEDLCRQIEAAGRTVGTGAGSSRSFQQRRNGQGA